MNNNAVLSLSQSASQIHKAKTLLKRIICVYFIALFVFLALSTVIADASIFGWIVKAIARIIKGSPPTLSENEPVTEEHLQALEWYQRGAYYILHVSKTPGMLIQNKFFYDTKGQVIARTEEEYNASKEYNASRGLQQYAFYHAWKQVADIYKALQAIGLALCIAYAVMYIIDSASADRVSPEQCIKITIRMLISVLIILNGMRIMEGMIGLANIIMNAVATSADQGESDAAIYNAVRNLDIAQSFNAMLEGIANFLRNGLVALVGLVSVYSRTIQICVLGAFAPIGFADSYNGMNSGAIRYGKRFFAALLQGALVMAVVMIASAMRVGIAEFNSGWGLSAETFLLGGSIPHIIITFSAIGAISSTKRWSEQIVGAM